MNKPDKFIIIDDDEQSNMICKFVVKQAIDSNINISTYTQALKGNDSINTEFQASDNTQHIILLLDINMPEINGWEALNMLTKLDDEVKNQLHLFMFSSSIDPKDKNQAKEHPMVTGFIEKPLTVEKTRLLVEEALKNVKDSKQIF